MCSGAAYPRAVGRARPRVQVVGVGISGRVAHGPVRRAALHTPGGPCAVLHQACEARLAIAAVTIAIAMGPHV